MNKGKYVFSQLISFVPRYQFDKCVKRYCGNFKVKHLTCWTQFMTMFFGQITHRESLRDSVTSLSAHQNKLYHLGFKHKVSRAALAKANERRNFQIYADFAQVLIAKARRLYLTDNDLSLEIENSIYALDSTTIDLCLSVFWWAFFRKSKAAIKLHTMLDLRGDIPTFIQITDGKPHDVKMLDKITFEATAFYLMGKA